MVIDDIIAGIVGAISDIVMSLITPIIHVPAYCLGALISSGLEVIVPLLDAINYVGSAIWLLLDHLVMIVCWLPPWLYVPIVAIVIVRALMVIIAIITKIVDTLLLRGWI